MTSREWDDKELAEEMAEAAKELTATLAAIEEKITLVEFDVIDSAITLLEAAAKRIAP